MISFAQNGITITPLRLNADIIIWCAKIPDIVHSVFKKERLGRLKAPHNETFQQGDFTRIFLSEKEIITLNGFKALKKQIEWMSGRCLIKHMIQSSFLTGVPLDQITVSYLDQGAPFLTHHPDIPVSLSHSNDYTAVACCKDKNKTFGIDIEKITRKPDIHFLKTAFTQKEITDQKDNAVDIFKCWTIKEAYLKYIKKGFNESLHAVEVINRKIWHHNKKIPVNVVSTVIDASYILSLVSD